MKIKQEPWRRNIVAH